ncbi:hypothetical protein BDW68DRAFT_168538 [Aspergillus falconensis]
MTASHEVLFPQTLRFYLAPAHSTFIPALFSVLFVYHHGIRVSCTATIIFLARDASESKIRKRG